MAGLYGLGAKLVLKSLNSVYSTSTGWSYPSTTATLVNITNIGEVNMTADDIDISTHESRVKFFLKGLVDMGEVPFTGNYLSSEGPVVKKHLTNAGDPAGGGSTEEQVIIVPGKFRMTFPGYVKAVSFGIPHDGKVSMNGALKVSGLATMYASTS